MVPLPIPAAPIQLASYEIHEQIVQLHPGGDVSQPSSGLYLGVWGDRSFEDDRVSLDLFVSVNETDPEGDAVAETNPHYRGRVVLRGEFLWIGGEDLPEEERRNLLTVNGLSVLYGIARVYLRQLAEPLPAPPLLLPTVSFRDALSALASPDAAG